MESYSRRFKSRKIRSKCRTDGTSAFNTRTARGRLLLLDPARGEGKLRESSVSTTAWWWWSSWFSSRASPSTMEEEEKVGGGRAAPGKRSSRVLGSPKTSNIYRGKGEGRLPRV